MTVLGTRPEIIRLSRIIEKIDCTVDKHVLVHTGQNTQPRMRDVFFDEMRIRQPNYRLDISDHGFGVQMGSMFTWLDWVMEQEKPDKVLVLGDTNTALCTVTLAKRRLIPIYHMEAGNRCFDEHVPEENNRRMIDAISTFNLPYTLLSRENLLREGFPVTRVLVSGNPIYEVLEHYEKEIDGREILKDLGIKPKEFILATVHRAENVDDSTMLRTIIEAFHDIVELMNLPIVLSVHPRTAAKLKQFNICVRQSRIILSEPFGFFDFIKLQKNAKCILTDSGTVQEESCILGIPAVTIRNSSERPETIVCGSNLLSGLTQKRIVECTQIALKSHPFWDIPPGYHDLNVSSKVMQFVCGGIQ
jgi:UDP-N-acetylglucosamine 2-epimerase (non-hydrolysing)